MIPGDAESVGTFVWSVCTRNFLDGEHYFSVADITRQYTDKDLRCRRI